MAERRWPKWYFEPAGTASEEEELAQGEVRGSCHCGAVTIRVPHPPEWVGRCNCSLCAKLAWLIAYYPDDAVTVEGETVAYIWGDGGPHQSIL